SATTTTVAAIRRRLRDADMAMTLTRTRMPNARMPLDMATMTLFTPTEWRLSSWLKS
ncbi:hypothetical protein EC957_008798, partial [Mortierella hygrophila]